MPFYFVQLPGLNRNWPPFREVQSKIDLLIPNTHMAITYDVGHPTNVHPTHKAPVGERLANLALKYEYGKAVTAEPPRFLGWVNGANSIQLRFDRPITLLGDAQVSVAGSDRKFKQLAVQTADSTGLGLTLNSVDPAIIESIRYAWENDPKPTIVCAETKIPVSPFRTDSWPLVAGSCCSSSQLSEATGWQRKSPASRMPSRVDSQNWKLTASPSPLRKVMSKSIGLMLILGNRACIFSVAKIER